MKSRFGFLKLAKEYGYDVRIVYGFGERDTFSNVQGFWGIRLWLNGFGIPAVLPYNGALGRWMPPLLPRWESGLDVWISRGLRDFCSSSGGEGTTTIAPLDEESTVAQWHARYVEMLEDLYARRNTGGGRLELW